jgi:hypothetical protein
MEAATTVETRESLFLSKYPEHKLIVQNARQPYVGADGRRMEGVAGRYIQFDKTNQFKTSDPEEIKFIREHSLFGTDIWEFGRAPGEAQPTVAVQLSAITRASVERDAVALKELIDAERSTHNRALILEQAETALAQIAGVDSE